MWNILISCTNHLRCTIRWSAICTPRLSVALTLRLVKSRALPLASSTTPVSLQLQTACPSHSPLNPEEWIKTVDSWPPSGSESLPIRRMRCTIYRQRTELLTLIVIFFTFSCKPFCCNEDYLLKEHTLPLQLPQAQTKFLGPQNRHLADRQQPIRTWPLHSSNGALWKLYDSIPCREPPISVYRVCWEASQTTWSNSPSAGDHMTALFNQVQISYSWRSGIISHSSVGVPPSEPLPSSPFIHCINTNQRLQESMSLCSVDEQNREPETSSQRPDGRKFAPPSAPALVCVLSESLHVPKARDPYGARPYLPTMPIPASGGPAGRW